jgi:hypothetical protein
MRIILQQAAFRNCSRVYHLLMEPSVIQITMTLFVTSALPIAPKSGHRDRIFEQKGDKQFSFAACEKVPIHHV